METAALGFGAPPVSGHLHQIQPQIPAPLVLLSLAPAGASRFEKKDACMADLGSLSASPEDGDIKVAVAASPKATHLLQCRGLHQSWARPNFCNGPVHYHSPTRPITAGPVHHRGPAPQVQAHGQKPSSHQEVQPAAASASSPTTTHYLPPSDPPLILGFGSDGHKRSKLSIKEGGEQQPEGIGFTWKRAARVSIPITKQVLFGGEGEEGKVYPLDHPEGWGSRFVLLRSWLCQ